MKLRLPLMLLALTIASALAQETQIGFAPPSPPQENRAERPGPRHIWIPGNYQWNGVRYVWINGFWVIPPGGNRAWIPGRWTPRNGTYVWVDGYWSGELRR